MLPLEGPFEGRQGEGRERQVVWTKNALNQKEKKVVLVLSTSSLYLNSILTSPAKKGVESWK